MTEKELAEMLRNNPELQIHDDGTRNHLPSIQDNGDRTTIHIPRPPVAKLSEYDLQASVIAKCDQRSILRPEYGLIFAIPNGQYRQGQRMEPGLRPGVPDLFLPVARHGYHGCFIELKVGDNKPLEKQLEWMRHLKAEGYLCRVFWDSLDEVIGFIEWYLEGK